MRAVDDELAGLEIERLANGSQHALLVRVPAEVSEQGDVEADEHTRPAGVERPQRERGRAQRAVDAVRDVMGGSAPHAGVDARGRSGVPTREPDQAGERGRSDFEWGGQGEPPGRDSVERVPCSPGRWASVLEPPQLTPADLAGHGER